MQETIAALRLPGALATWQEVLTAGLSMRQVRQRAVLLAALAPRFPYPQRDVLLREALAALSALWDEIERGDGLTQMVPFLPKTIKKEMQQRILEIAHSCKGMLTRSRVFTALLPIVPSSLKKEVRQEAINAVMAIKNAVLREEELEKLFVLLPPSWRRILIMRAVAEARETDELNRTWAVRALLPLLSKPLKGDALVQILETVQQTRNLKIRAELIGLLVPFLPKSYKRRWLNDVLNIISTVDEHERESVITHRLPCFAEMLTEKEMQEVATLVRKIRDEENRAEALVTLIPLASEPLKSNFLQEVLTILHSLDNGFGYDWVMENLIRIIPMPQQRQVLQEAITITEQISDESIQARNIEFMAPYLSQDQSLLWRAFTMALKMSSNRHRTRALRYLYRYFLPALLPEALDRTVAIEDEVARAWGIIEISSKLTDDQLLQEALEAALAISEQYARTLALAGLAFALEEREQAPREHLRQLLDALPEGQRYGVLEDMVRSCWIWYRLFIVTAAADDISPTQTPLTVPDWSQRFEPLPPLRPVQERIVSTGFSPYEQADMPLSRRMPLTCGQQYYFWLEIGPPVAESIENTPEPLPIEHLPSKGELLVVLHPLDNELQVMSGDAIGRLEWQPDGSIRVIAQPDHPVGIAPESELLLHRLFFPVKVPSRTGKFRFECHIYYESTLIQSRQVYALVMEQPVLRPLGRASYSILDYSLSKTLNVPRLDAKGSHAHRISMTLKDKGDGTHHFLFLSKDGTQVVKGHVNFGEQQLAGMVKKMRGAFRSASWGDEQDWNIKKQYRYGGVSNVQRLKEDLVLFAIRGFRFHYAISLPIDSDQRKQLSQLMAKPGLVQFALEKSASSVLPLSMVYDYPLNTNIDRKKYMLCSSFEEALHCDKPLEEWDCFQGSCPSKGQDNVVCPSGFWGYRHAFGMPLSIENRPEIVQEISYQRLLQITVGVSTDPAFTELAAHEQALRSLRPEWHETDIKNTGWYYANNSDTVFRLLNQAQSHLIYFYCHGGVNDEIPYLSVGYNEPVITPDNLYQVTSWRDQGPLVFINGCKTTAMEPKLAIAFAQAFINGLGASGVIGTEISIFEPLACAFAENCLRYFLGGLPIGEAIRRARLVLLKQANPLGLVYVPFVIGDLRLVDGMRI
jgi:hypothetical protein